MAKREQKLLRIGAAAHELGLHPITVRRWIKAGRIQVVQMGREVRVARAEIERMVGKLDGRLLVLYGRVSEHGQYEELQPIPVLKVGMLTYAGDDSREKGQAYRLALDVDAGVARFRFRSPDEAGVWHWRKVDTIIPLPTCLKERLSDGELMAPALREERRADGDHAEIEQVISCACVAEASRRRWEVSPTRGGTALVG